MVLIYLDENVNILLASLLRARNVHIVTALESTMLGKSDHEQLEFATQHHSAIVTHNRVDFENIFQQYVEEGKKFSGIVILRRRNVYRMAQLLSKFELSHENIDNLIWYV